MRKGRRSAERLSYWPELGSRALTRREQEMPRSFAVNNKCFPMAAEAVISLVVVVLMGLTLSTRLQAQGPALTTISGTVYRADGTAASGTALISWPSFQSAEGDAVAAGHLSVTIGPLGAFTAQLVPNVGASPAGTYYVVVFQLDDGTVRTEYWAVPATSPTTIAAVLTTPGTGLGNLAATQQYVNTAVATRALDATVVHLAGSETITGTKHFAVPPALPAPAGANDAANKGYVDAAVANVGAGSFVSKAGDTMTGPLTLPADPTAPNQATDRHYVDSGLSVKADLVNGAVPSGELGAGVASAATCLNGNSTWGSCGGGAPAGITYATTALNWTQTTSSSLTGGTPGTVLLAPCPAGVDYTSGAGYQVYITDGASSEAVAVTGGSTGSGNCSITFTPFFSHASYTIGSASSGIQETINAACGVDPTFYKNSQCNVTIPANGPGYPAHSLNTYDVFGTIIFHANQATLSGPGVSLNCHGRAHCLQVGDQIKSLNYQNNTIQGLAFRSPDNNTALPAYNGCAITQTQKTGTVATITTATSCGFRPGDIVTIQFTDDSGYWGDAIVATSSGTSFTFAKHNYTTTPLQSTPGVVALAHAAILDNGQNTHFDNILYDNLGEAGTFNNFFDFWDDENALVEHYNNNGASLTQNINWTGSHIYSGGGPIGPAGNPTQQWAPVITLRDSSITANYSNGVTVQNSNGLYIENTVLQATGPWQVKSSNETGNYQGAYLKNIYSESSTALNPLSPPRSPFPGLGIAGLIAGVSSGAASFQLAGNGSPVGAFATGGSGSTPYTYFIIANDTTASTQTSPMQVLNWLSTGSDPIPVRWPRVANGNDAITYDVIRITTPVGVGSIYPYAGGCPGGSGGTCGYVAQGLSQATACNVAGVPTLVCTYTDNGSSSTSAYTIKQANYGGNLNFWPGSVVSVSRSVTVDVEVGNVVGVGLNGNALQIANQCSGYGAASPGGYTTCLGSLSPAGNSVKNQTATIMTDGPNSGGGMSLSKGRLNFSTTAASIMQPHHIITLIDSQPALTQATSAYRPLANANDVWIGTDVPSGGVGLTLGQLAFGAPVSISNYIAHTGDGIAANWLERLSASLKEFNVPAKFDQSVTLAGLSNGCLNVASGVIASTGSPCGTGGGGGVNTVFGRSGAVVAASGDYTVSQVTGAAPLASPTFTGTPSGPTANPGDSSTKLATTAFVQSALPANSTTIPWLTFSHGGSNINFSTATNKAIFTGVVLDFAKTTSQVSYNVSTADNTSNTYDLGVYSGTSGGTCTQQAHIGPTAGTSFASSTGWKTTSWTGGSVTLQPGRYYLAYTTSCTTSCATLIGDTGGFTFAGSSGGANSNVTITSGGTLPATATCPSDGYATTSAPNWAIN